jgi:hypothetical protein
MLMYHILCSLVMDGHVSLSLTSQSLLYGFGNVLYIRSIFTGEHVLSGMVTPTNAVTNYSIFSVLTCIPSL